jgi:hypothetical protein
MAPSAAEQGLAWAIVVAVIGWSYLWKCIAFWKAARRDQLGWYVLMALVPPFDFGVVEMIYVFWVGPRAPELDETGF